MDPQLTIDALGMAEQALKSGDTRSKLRALHAAHCALEAHKAVLLAELEASKDCQFDAKSD